MEGSDMSGQHNDMSGYHRYDGWYLDVLGGWRMY